MRTFELKNRRYLGSKRSLIPAIQGVLDSLPYSPQTAVDIFAGTGMVGQSFLGRGVNVTFNDLLRSNGVVHRAFFSREDVSLGDLALIVDEVNHLDPNRIEDNYFSETFGGLYFSRDNAKLIGHLRELAEGYPGRERDILITSALYAADKVACTVGHYDAFRPGAEESPRVIFGLPELKQYRGVATVFSTDANELARNGSWDVAYLDPPYNSRQYGDMYHVLENLADWNKPEVEFKARKMDRKHLRSQYSMNGAVAALTDLVQNLDVQTIIFSYNDTGERGNSRSAAKVSDEEIREILSSEGPVEVIEIDHRPFTTGRSGIGSIAERLFVCHVRDDTVNALAVPAPLVRPELVKSPLNYVGNKKALVPQLLPIFDQVPGTPTRFVDVFAGGMTVGMNSGFDNVWFNDISVDVMELGKLFASTDYGDLIREVESLIERFGLSESDKNGYAFYGADSSGGLGQVNKPHYLKLREFLDEQPAGTRSRVVAFFTAVVFSFNNQIRFNSTGKFNMPVGKRDFNSRVRANLFSTMSRLGSIRPEFSKLDFREVLDSVGEGDFVYCDPPYLLGTAPYNEQGGWSLSDEHDLLERLARIDAKGIAFALSNVAQSKGHTHEVLLDWVDHYGFTVRMLEKSYGNSSYQRKKSGPTSEVLVTNF